MEFKFTTAWSIGSPLFTTGLSLVTQEDDLSMFLLLWDFKPIMYTLWSRNTFVYWGHNSAVDEVNGVFLLITVQVESCPKTFL